MTRGPPALPGRRSVHHVPRGATDSAWAMQRGMIVMSGVVTTRDIFTHSPLIVREFGLRCLARCVWRSLRSEGVVTFLECI